MKCTSSDAFFSSFIDDIKNRIKGNWFHLLTQMYQFHNINQFIMVRFSQCEWMCIFSELFFPITIHRFLFTSSTIAKNNFSKVLIVILLTWEATRSIQNSINNCRRMNSRENQKQKLSLISSQHKKSTECFLGNRKIAIVCLYFFKFSFILWIKSYFLV